MLSKLFGNNGKDLGAFFKASLSMFGETLVMEPSMSRFWFSFINHVLVISSIGLFIYGIYTGLATGIVLFWVIILLPYSFFYHIRKRSLQVWLTYSFITRGQCNTVEAEMKVASQKWSIRGLALIELLFASRSRSNNNDRPAGVIEGIGRMLFSIVETLFDVSEDYLLPAVVIEQSSLKDLAPKLKQLKSNVPAVLAGAFVFDLFGSAISSLASLIYLFILMVGVGIGFVIVSFVPTSLQTGRLSRQA
jgi:hypothetical protein